MDEMYAAVGHGSISAHQIIFRLIDFFRKEKPVGFQLHATGNGKAPGGVLINGQAGMLVRFAGCCSPVPGDAIVGYTSRGRGVVIHRADCKSVQREDAKERLLPAEWQIAPGAKQRYNVNISIRATDQGAALAVLSFVVGEMKLSITSVNGRIDKNNDAILEAQISFADISEVELFTKKLLADKRIYEVYRTV